MKAIGKNSRLIEISIMFCKPYSIDKKGKGNINETGLLTIPASVTQ